MSKLYTRNQFIVLAKNWFRLVNGTRFKDVWETVGVGLCYISSWEQIAIFECFDLNGFRCLTFLDIEGFVHMARLPDNWDVA